MFFETDLTLKLMVQHHLTPKAARDNVMVGALARLPAKEDIATNEKLPSVPITAAAVACQKEIPNPRKKVVAGPC